MTTPFERVKAAWVSSDRRAQLHRVIEAMAAEGYRQQALEEALEALLLQVRAAGVDDETEEIINGVWDRLTGWCEVNGHIKTQPTNQSAPSTTVRTMAVNPPVHPTPG